MKTKLWLRILVIGVVLVSLVAAGGCVQVKEPPAEDQTAAPPGITRREASREVTPAETEKPLVAPAKATEKPLTADEAETEATAEDIVIIKPPDVALDKYCGLWLPFWREVEVALGDIDHLKADGVNIVAIGIMIYMEEDSFKDKYETEIRKAISKFHQNGIHTLLIPNPAYPDSGIDPNSSQVSLSTLLEQVTPLVLRWASLAEQYGVEIFCPLNEPQLLFNSDEKEVSDWAQDILPDLREIYHGKLAFLAQGSGEGLPAYDLTGYDYVLCGGFTCSQDIMEHPDWIDNLIEEGLDDLETAYPDHHYIFLGTMAFTGPDYYWWEPIAPVNMPGHMPDLPVDFFVLSHEGQAEFYDRFFNKTWNRVDGHFIAVVKGSEYRGKPAEQVVREWFNSGKSGGIEID